MTQNSQRRAHWSEVRKAKADTEFLVGLALNKAKLTKIGGPISVRVVWYAADARRRDVDSLSVLLKSCLDALEKRNVIANDDYKTVREVVLGPIVVARDNPRIEIQISEVDEDG
jgi:Holliday junction resolvase RusA-like endonuclease